jgi:hypothetical protein
MSPAADWSVGIGYSCVVFKLFPATAPLHQCMLGDTAGSFPALNNPQVFSSHMASHWNKILDLTYPITSIFSGVFLVASGNGQRLHPSAATELDMGFNTCIK